MISFIAFVGILLMVAGCVLHLYATYFSKPEQRSKYRFRSNVTLGSGMGIILILLLIYGLTL